jgi:hypothetical protein
MTEPGQGVLSTHRIWIWRHFGIRSPDRGCTSGSHRTGQHRPRAGPAGVDGWGHAQGPLGLAASSCSAAPSTAARASPHMPCSRLTRRCPPGTGEADEAIGPRQAAALRR